MKTQRILKMLAVVAIIFGALTVFSGGRALFGDAQARASVGNAVGFVLWFNFLAGFAYVVTGIGLWVGRGDSLGGCCIRRSRHGWWSLRNAHGRRIGPQAPVLGGCRCRGAACTVAQIGLPGAVNEPVNERLGAFLGQLLMGVDAPENMSLPQFAGKPGSGIGLTPVFGKVG